MNQRFVRSVGSEQRRRKPAVEFGILLFSICQKALQSHNKRMGIFCLLSSVQQPSARLSIIKIKAGRDDQVEHSFLDPRSFQQCLVVTPVLDGNLRQPTFIGRRPDHSHHKQQQQQAAGQQQTEWKQPLRTSKRSDSFSNRTASRISGTLSSVDQTTRVSPATNEVGSYCRSLSHQHLRQPGNRVAEIDVVRAVNVVVPGGGARDAQGVVDRGRHVFGLLRVRGRVGRVLV